MNWLLILVVLVIAGNIVWGFYRGFFRVVYSMVAWVLILVFVTFATPYVSDVLTEHTGIDEKIEANCNEKLHEWVQGKTDAPEADSEDEKKEPDTEESNAEEADSLAELGMQLPQAILDKLLDTNRAADMFLEESGAYAELSVRATDMAMRGISFVLVLLITILAFHIISTALDLMAKLPVIEEVNHFLGGAAGLIKGFLFVWLVFAFVAMGSATSIGTTMNGYIYESELLVWLYEHNLVLTILMIFL